MNVLTVARKDLSILLKDKGAVAVYFLMPLLFATLMGQVNRAAMAASEGKEIQVAVLVANQDGGPYGRQVAEGLRQAGVLKVEEVAAADEADRRVARSEAAAAIVIPADFSARIDAGEPTAVQVLKDPTQQQAAGIAAGIADQALAEVGMVGELKYGIHAVLAQSPEYEQAGPELRAATEAQTLGAIWAQVQQMRQAPVITVKSATLEGAEAKEPWNPIIYTVPSFTVAFAFFLVGTMASTLLQEKEQGTFRRLLASPLPRGQIVGGKALAYGFVVLLQVLLMFAVGVIVFDMPLGHSPAGLILVTVAMALTSAGLGMLLGALCRTSKQADGLGVMLGFILMALGGCIWPFFKTQGVLGTLSRLTPHAHAVDSYMRLMADNATLMDVLPSIGILGLFAAAFFAIAVWRFRYE